MLDGDRSCSGFEVLGVLNVVKDYEVGKLGQIIGDKGVL